MKSLPIDKNFTIQYLKDIKSFTTCINANWNKFKWMEDKKARTALQHFADNIDSYLRRAGGKKPIKGKQCLEIRPNLLLKIEEPSLVKLKNTHWMLALGGHIEILDGILDNQSFGIYILCQVAENLTADQATKLDCQPLEKGIHVIRKFHFDIDRSKQYNDRRSLSHLQYGGKFNSSIFPTDQSPLYHLLSALDLPRVPVLPMSFIMCMDFALRTFPTTTKSLTNNNDWKRQVTNNEKHWFLPHLQLCLDFLSQADRKDTLFDFYAMKN